MSTIQDFARRVQEITPASALSIVIGRYGTALSRRMEARRRSAVAAIEVSLDGYASPFTRRWVQTARRLCESDSHRVTALTVRSPL